MGRGDEEALPGGAGEDYRGTPWGFFRLSRSQRSAENENERGHENEKNK